MKPCADCNGPLRRGWTGGGKGNGDNVRCLICQTARIMASFVWPKKGH